MSLPELDREDFRLWLAAKGPDEGVGRRHSRAGCPIARYLTARTGERWEVEDTWYRPMNDPVQQTPHPAWAQAFVHRVDFPNGEISFDMIQEVPAKAALTLLDSIEVAP